ncbi:dienelactone hydrolase family protein [bacterium]|nr:dienelactone hydrolase family protein [bacterium]
MKILLSAILFLSSTAFAKIKTETVEYKDGDAVLEGAVVYDTAFVKKNKKLPGVVIVHNWMGVGEFVMMRAEQLAKLGYVAFVADIYGKGIRPKDAKEAGALAGKYKAGERKEMRTRATAAFNTLASNKLVDANKIAAMGYCFGGTVALDMARVGLPITGAISFHGGLASAKADDAKSIKTKILVQHGAIDPFVPVDEVMQFLKELNENKVNYQFISYSGAVHSFTEKAAGDDITKGAAYNQQADERSFIALKNFLEEVMRH